MAKTNITAPTQAIDSEPITHLQREVYGNGRALCGAPPVTMGQPLYVPVPIAFANAESLMNRRLCANCVRRFQRIRSM